MTPTEIAKEGGQNYWVILFEDFDRKPEIFTDEDAARQAFREYLVNWHCHLFCHISRLTAETQRADKFKAIAGELAHHLTIGIRVFEEDRFWGAVNKAKQALACYEAGIKE